jgi:hypothetical protein
VSGTTAEKSSGQMIDEVTDRYDDVSIIGISDFSENPSVSVFAVGE